MKKFICLISTCLILVSLLSITAFAAYTRTPSISITTVNATPGDTVEAKIYLKNNPGIVSAKLDFNFDEKLTLIGADNGDAFSALTYIPPRQLSSGPINSSCQFAWQGFDIDSEDIKDGHVLTLVFKVSDDAQPGDILNVSVSSTWGNVIDKELNPYLLEAQKAINVLDFLPGDVNGDGRINMLDTVALSRYIVDGCVTDPNGYNITLRERAANVNDDGAINMLDVVLICRYIVDGCETVPDPDGYDVELIPQKELCLHNLVITNGVAATCTENGNIEYWHCTKCGRYYRNATASQEITFAETIVPATGHTEMIDEAVPPTYDASGLTEGKHCSVCDTVLIAQETIPALIPTYHSVSFTNVKTADITEYPTQFAEHAGLDLSDLIPQVIGYTFAGWYVGDTQLTAIPVGYATDVELTASWTPVTVTVTLRDTELPPSYTVSFNLNGVGGTAPAAQTVTATNGLTYPVAPPKSGYVFDGWYATPSCTGAPYDFAAPVTGDMTLYAKWVRTTNKPLTLNTSNGITLTSSSVYYSFIPLTSGDVTISVGKNGSIEVNGSSGYGSLTVSCTAGTMYTVCVYSYRGNTGSSYTGQTFLHLTNATPTAGGKVAGFAPQTQQLAYDDDDFTLTVPEKVGYTFDGWFDGINGTGTKYTDGDGESVKTWDKLQNTTLYAKWIVNTYDLTLDNQGGTGESSVTVTYGEAMPALTAPTKTGYTFAGYYDAETGGTKYYNADMTGARAWDVDEAITLYAHWTADSNVITLDNQGGTGASSVNATFGSALPTLAAPTKAGHTFLGYYDAVTGGTQYYSATMESQVTWNRTEPLTLYARWEAIESTVTFNTNQGTGAQAAVTATYGSDMPAITVAPTRTGYTFTGYYDAITGGTKYYNADLSSAKTWDKESDTVLYARWQAISYQVSFNANGGTGTMADQEFAYGTSESLSSNTFTRTGYTFAGWNTAADGSGTSYTNAESVLNLTSVADATVTLYAKWTPVTVTVTLDDPSLDSEVTVTFNKNYSGSTANTVTLENGDVLPYPTNPTRSGYRFTGWYTTASCTTKYNFSGTITDDMTLYAGWTTTGYTTTSSSWSVSGSSLTSTNKTNSSSSEYKITASIPLTVSFSYRTSSEANYDWLYIKKNGATLKSCSGSTTAVAYSVNLAAGDYLSFIYAKDSSQSSGSDAAYITNLTYTSNVMYSSTATVSCRERERIAYDSGFTLDVPEKVGYTFAGWYDGVGGTGTQYTDGEGESVKTWDKTQDTTLYAKWIGDTYQLTLDNQGGTGATSVTATFGQAMPTLAAPTKTGYTFAGYYDAVTGGVMYYNANMTSVKTWDVDGTATLYARWTTNGYTITLNNQGGTGATTATAIYGSALPTLAAPTKAGHTFLGYYDAVTGGTQYYSATMESQVTWTRTEPITLYARWEVIEYTVTFNTNQGTGAQTAVTVTYGSNMPAITVTPTRTGYTFVGYYDALTGGTKYYNADLTSARTWNKETDTVLYARWQGVPYKVSFNANGGTGTMADQELVYGASESLSSNSFTKTGYTFAGWNTAADGSGTSYANAASVLNLTSVADATVTLYAKWTPVTVTVTLNETSAPAQYNVSFNLNGASGTAPATQTVTATNGLTYPAIPTRSGYVFAGWYATSACTGTPYDFSAAVTQNTTLYAKWISYSGAGIINYNDGMYLYAYSQNSGSARYYAFVPLRSGTVTIYSRGTSLDSYGNLYSSSKSLLTSDDQSGEGNNFSISYSVTAGTLYYIRVSGWGGYEGYTTVFVSGPTIPVGGKAETPWETQQLTYDDDDFALTVPEKVGYTFAGWYDGVGGTGTQYTDSDGESVKTWDKGQDTTLYAKWTGNTHTLTLDNQGGTGATSVIATYNAAMPTLAAPTKTGYTFQGYYNAETGGTKYYNADMTSAKAWDLDDSDTLYARWTANTYAITLNNQGGTGATSATATYGLALPTVTAPTKAGYRFLGYYDAATGGTQYYSATMESQVTWTRTEPITLYAQWEIIAYTVSFNTNQGTGAQTAVTVTYGANMSAITVAPTRTGYTFQGYYDAVTGGTKYYNADLSSAKTWDKESNATLYAHWQGVPYKVSFNANGGTGTMADQEFVYGTSEYLDSNVFTRTGYTFAGWNTAADGSGTSYANAASVLNLTSVADATVTLYAKWTPVTVTVTLNETSAPAQYNVSFSLNGASGTAPATQTVTTTRGLTYPAIPTRSGYVFAGWYTSSACTGTPYNFAANVTQDLTLYAKWVSYSGAGYVNYNSNKSVYAYSKNSSTVQYYAFVPLVSGNVAIYTSCSSDTYGYLYNSSKTLITSDDDSGDSTNFRISYNVTAGTLYYIRVCGYSSNLSGVYVYISGANVATGGKAQLSCQTENIAYDSEFTLDVPEKVGYTFDGWFDGVGGTGTRYTDGDGESVKAWDKTQNTTLYAKWTANTHTLTLDNQGGTGATSVSVTYDAAMPALTAPTKTGYTFAGYYNATSGGTKYYNADMTSARNWNVDDTDVLYARWTANAYTVTLDNQGGTGASSVTATFGSGLPTVTVPTKTGYRFLGYYDAVTGGTQYYSSTMAGQVTWNLTEPLTLYARWEIVEYAVSFNTNQGTGAQSAVEVTYGANMPTITVAPTRTGYIFTGYYDAITDGTKYYNADLSSAKTWDKESDTVLYAQWQGVPYKVSFNANGGTGTMAEQAFVYGTRENLDSNTLTRTGYTFAGWNTAADGTGTSYANAASVLNLTSVADATVTLYAKWTANNYDITLDDIRSVEADVTVTFNKNYSGSTATTVTLENGDVLAYPTNPTRSGYRFTGWYTTSACTTKYNFNSTITEDMTLYAGWTTTGYTTSPGSWSVSGSSLTSTNKSHSSTSEYRITASIPLRVQFSYRTSSETNFDYLRIKKNGTTLVSCSGSTTAVAYSVTLAAGDYLSFVYSKDGSQSIGSDAAYITGLTYTSNVSYTSTATALCSEVDGYIYDAASSVTTDCDYDDTFTLPAPIRAGYTFDGWFDGVGGTGTRYTDNEGESVRTWDKGQDTTLYAKWISVTYQITYELDGGTNHAENPSTYTTADNSITLNKPTKAGYSFTGWTTATNSTPVMDYTIRAGSMGNITLTANWIEYDVLDIEYDDSVDAIGINTALTAEYFGATCLDTDNNEVDITVTYSGSKVGGQTVDIILTAQSGGQTSTTTIEDVKVYGIPTITIDDTIINSSESITASTFDATALDSFGEELDITIELFQGSATGGGNKVYTFSAKDECNNIVSTNRTVMVYCADEITFTLTEATAIKDDSTGQEFSASATDSFGNACSVAFVVRSGSKEAGKTISVCFEATDVNGNKKTSQVISNVKVYGDPTITCLLPKITAQTDVNDIFKVEDSFGVALDVTAQFVSTPVAGSNVGVRLVAQDAAGNAIDVERTTYVICVNHAISANCTCEICDEVIHTPGEDCECLICGATSHELDDECCCENCGNSYHTFAGGACTVCGRNDSNIWNGTIATAFAGGSGTSASPYIIETGAQLAYLAQSVNNGTSYSGKYFRLDNDIDLNNLAWTPIGRGSLTVSDDVNYTSTAFSGNFDGNGHTISNCKVNTTTYKRAGLFGALNGAHIEKLSVVDADIRITQTNVISGGVLAGTIYNTTITTCHVSGEVYVVDTASSSPLCANGGMIAGRANGTCSIQNCSASGSVTGRKTNSHNAYVGGLVGSGDDGNLTIRYCYFNGNVTAEAYDTGYAGGIIGIEGNSAASVTITKCFVVANLTSSDNRNSIACSWSSGASVSGCYYNTGITTSPGTSTAVSNLKSQSWLSTNLGWDFTNTWEVSSGAYPTLKIFNQ